MKLSAKSRYAVRLMLDLAMHVGRGPQRTAALSEHTGVTVRFIEQILKPLKKSGLVDSVRGAAGGYILAGKPEDVTLAAILRVVEGDLSLTHCRAAPEICHRSQVCKAHQAWGRVSRALEAELSAISLADLMEPLPLGSQHGCDI
ncbi:MULTISPECIES: Rrf2 family transcriptional regulator [Desulfovibrio]|jgi:Rrf2 family protein|uniref:RrF2 family transcriptional regulator n=1 Tax=Desulfovibrio TaxID=872 RepID=UPI0003F7F547|nr:MULTISPECIES: Rrf2 family transcriptional regulator [Desulfovibrio]MDY0307398.1 Rrf2 family transcriptional regulator [Desulfovibrionaceae bacterium]HMM39398.1 Rrf2 family transcriptional regulator [Desulfovibrio sp.]